MFRPKESFELICSNKSSWLAKSSSLASEAIFSSVKVGFGDEFSKLGKSTFSSGTEVAGGTGDFFQKMLDYRWFWAFLG